MTPPLTVLYRDARLVAVHKPPGLLVHRSRLAADDRFLVQMLRDQLGQWVYPVHRLDRGTSGVMVFALDPATAGRLGAAFMAGEVDKVYHGVVRGWPPPEGSVDHPLDDPESGRGRRPAVTRYRTLATVELPIPVDRYPVARYALVEARPRTGRRHQVRRHLKHLAHPLVGDVRYGKGPHNRLFREHFGVSRLLLFARRLVLAHPQSGTPLVIDGAPDPQWATLMDRLGWGG